MPSRHLHKVTYGRSSVCRQNVSIRNLTLQHSPHALDVLSGEAPVARRIEIAKFQHRRLSGPYSRNTVSDLASYKLESAQRRFMIKQNTAATKNVVTFSIIYCRPVRKELRATIRTARIKTGLFYLRNRLDLAEHLGGARLIKPNLPVDYTDGLKQMQRTDTCNLGCRDGLLKRRSDKALGGKVIYFVRLVSINQTYRRARISDIIFDQSQILVIQDAEFLDPPKIGRTAPTMRSNDLITLGQQQFRQISTILTGYPSN